MARKNSDANNHGNSVCTMSLCACSRAKRLKLFLGAMHCFFVSFGAFLWKHFASSDTHEVYKGKGEHGNKQQSEYR